MRKSINKTVVIIVLALFLTISVGYALFSDTITIEGTATAQGEFKVEKTCIPGFSAELQNIFAEDDAIQNGYFDDYCTVTDEGVTFGASLKYPGSNRAFTLQIKNNNDFTIRAEDFNYDSVVTIDDVEYDCDIDENMCKAVHIGVGIGDAYFVQNGELVEKDGLDIEPGETMYLILYTDWSDNDTGELTNDKSVSVREIMNIDLIQLAQ